MNVLKQIVITIRAILGWPFVLIGFGFFITGEFITGRVVTYRAGDVKNQMLAEWTAQDIAKQQMFQGNGFRKRSNKKRKK